MNKMIEVDQDRLIDLIKAHCEGDNKRFTDVAYQVAMDLKEAGKEQHGEYLLAILSDGNAFSAMSGEVVGYRLVDNNTGAVVEEVGDCECA